jgi:hypothetical protein
MLVIKWRSESVRLKGMSHQVITFLMKQNLLILGYYFRSLYSVFDIITNQIPDKHLQGHSECQGVIYCYLSNLIDVL